MPEVKNYKKETPDDDRLVIRSDKERKEKPKKRIFWPYFAAAFFIFILFVSAFINYNRQAVSSGQSDFSYFEIKKGVSTAEIGVDLRSANLIRSSWTFYLVSKFSGKTLQAGYYKLSPSMKLDEIIKKISSGEIDAFSATIPEGYRNLQIAKLLNEKGNVNETKFIATAAGTEGTLYPDTYLFPTNVEPAKIVSLMKENYDKKTSSLNPSEDQMVLASIVQRETREIPDMAKIAAVYKNRADQNMLFQADPTVRYALDSQQYLTTKSVDFTFWKGITTADTKSVTSAFNTYRTKGYPPAPICNPGLDAIRAALNPEPNFPYLYFFADKDQKEHFSMTYADHLKGIQEFGLAGN